MLREKYNRSELINIVTKHKQLEKELENLRNELRETTFQVEEDTRL